MPLPEAAASSVYLLGLAMLLQGISGVPLLVRKGSPAAQRAGAALLVLGALFGLAGALQTLLHSSRERYLLDWGLPFGPAEIGIDPLSALFLLPVLVVTGLSAVYALSYWPARKHRGNAGKLTFFQGLLTASLVGLLLARNGVLLLFAWEIMALSAYFCLTTEDEKPEVREAGTLYLITAHLGALLLFALFSLIRAATGSFVFPVAGSLTVPAVTAAAIFVVALLGFGLKAGVMPLHVWLPSAHANAPSHISAILSGVVLKTGVYGLIRVISFFSEIPLWWGGTILVLGMISALAGVAFALGQHDLKRLLAYHSIENIGIIMMGVGLALIGATLGNPLVVALGMAGALLHVVNHACFKALLFYAAGGVIHATGTREIELMGGVARALPKGAFLFLVGAAAICGLPPLNGFVSELMVYLGAFYALRLPSLAGVLASLSAPVLALVGGLAVACFVKVYGVVFLGTPRSLEHEATHEMPLPMLLPAALLALCCILIGLNPDLVAFALNAALTPFAMGPVPPIETLAPLLYLSLTGGALLVIGISLWFLLRRRGRSIPTALSGTWGCGYLAPTARMQYSASSFAETLTGWFSLLLCTTRHQKKVEGVFPGPSRYESHVPEAVLELVFLPFFEYLYAKSAPLRRLQHGKLNIYIFYTFVTLVVLLATTLP